MGSAGPELRHALRALWKSPGFAAAAALTLALGVGANSAIFSVIDAILLRPLPYPDPGRMVMLWQTQKVDPNRFADPESVKAMRHWMVDNTSFDRWRQQSRSFETMAAYRWLSYGLSGGGEPERVEGGIVSAGFFPLLGVQPMLGRAFSQEEDQPGNNQVVILSHRLWMKRFAGNRAAIGAKILVEGVPHTVLGVMPQNFEPVLPTFSKDIDVWVPSTHEMKTGRPWDIFYVSGRLQPGVPAARAEAELAGILKGLAAERPRLYAGRGVDIVPMAEEIGGKIRPALLVLLGASGCVLLIACANLANLLLARALTRQREIGIRTVLGANRWALMRQPLIESGIVGLAGGIAGLFLTGWGIRVLIAAAPKDMLPRSGAIGLDARVLAFGLLVSLGAG
ncbi:MAG: ABC transporter permease, partial [Acidobacteriia bacterium]|nr:ABC transporter permease [Terriglobia bacterium]